MKLYYSPAACSLAAHVALEEVGAAFEPVRVAIAEDQQRRPQFLALNPQGRVPVLEVEGEVLTELPAILFYVSERFPAAGLMPTQPWSRAQVMSLMAFLASNVHIGFAGVWRQERFTDDEQAFERMGHHSRRMLRDYFGLVEMRLPQRGWVGGDRFTLADINLLPFYRFGWRVGLPMRQFERYTALVDAASRRSAVVRVMQREGVASLLEPVTAVG